MTSVTGVSGSGKSSLVSGILAPSLQRALHNADTSPGKHKSIEGIEKIDKTIIIDQSLLVERHVQTQQHIPKYSIDKKTILSNNTFQRARIYSLTF